MTTIFVRSTSQPAVAEAVKKLPRRGNAYVSPVQNGWVAVFEETMDEPDEDRLSGYTVMLSEKLSTLAIGSLVVESDVLLYTLAENGRLLDQYSSWPDYFDENLPDAEFERLEGKPSVLARAFGVPAEVVRRALEAEHDFAEDSLAGLLRALGLPDKTAGFGYHDVADESADAYPARWQEYVHIPFRPLSMLPAEE